MPDSEPPSPPDLTTSESKESMPQWLLWALGSGAFAATNGVFAKLTTADTTHHLSERLFASSPFAEYVLRASFFGLNLVSNAIMWILFTRALTAASSTTRVSVLNTSANFLVTAVYGLVVFGERFGVEWVLGAALLVTGCVIIGRREGGEVEKGEGEIGEVAGREGAIRLSGEQRRGRSADEHEGEGGDALIDEDDSGVQEETRKEREVWDRTD